METRHCTGPLCNRNGKRDEAGKKLLPLNVNVVSYFFSSDTEKIAVAASWKTMYVLYTKPMGKIRYRSLNPGSSEIDFVTGRMKTGSICADEVNGLVLVLTSR